MVSKQQVLDLIPKGRDIEYLNDTDVICHGGCRLPGYKVSVNGSRFFRCQSIGIFNNNGIWILDLHDLYGVYGLDNVTNSLSLHLDDIQDLDIQIDN